LQKSPILWYDDFECGGEEKIVAALRILPGKIAEIRRMEVGLDELHSEWSYDFAWVSTAVD